MANYKTIFIGTSTFGLPALEALLRLDYQIIAVITAPDKPVGRQQKITASPIKLTAQKYNLEVWQPTKIAEVTEKIKQLKPDLIITAAYGQILPEQILNSSRYGSLNIHSSLLPKHRGASPIQSAILAGDEITGVTLMLMDKDIDHGPVIDQKVTLIEPYDTAQTLHDKLSKLAVELIDQSLPRYLSQQIKPKIQDESQATFTKILTKQDGQIDFSKTASEIERQIRAYDPWPSSWTNLYNKRVKILKAKIVEQASAQTLKTAKCYLLPQIVQPEGKEPMRWEDFLRGVK